MCFRPGQRSTASSSSSRPEDEVVEWGFRTFPRVKKSAGSGRQCGDHPAGGVSTLGSHQMAPAGVAAHSSSSTPAACVPDERVGVHGRTWLATGDLPRRWWLLGDGVTGDVFWDEPGWAVAAAGEGGERASLQGLLPGQGSAAFCEGDLR